jgi:hypothetical protein
VIVTILRGEQLTKMGKSKIQKPGKETVLSSATEKRLKASVDRKFDQTKDGAPHKVNERLISKSSIATPRCALAHKSFEPLAGP